MPPKHELSGILFDMDGVLYNSDHLIAGAVDAVAWVQAQGIPHLFLTNTTSRSRAVLAEKLVAFGIQASETETLTPAAAVAAWLRSIGDGQVVLDSAIAPLNLTASRCSQSSQYNRSLA